MPLMLHYFPLDGRGAAILQLLQRDYDQMQWS
jgi:hypothetical protein